MNRQTEGGADYSGRKLKYNVQNGLSNIFYYGTDVVGDLHPLHEPDFFAILKKCT